MDKNLKFKSMKSRLTFWFLVIALAPLMASGLLIYEQRVRFIKSQAFEHLETILEFKVGTIRDWRDRTMRELRAVAEARQVRELGDVLIKGAGRGADAEIVQDTRDLLDSYQANSKDLQEIFIIDASSGRIEISTDRDHEGRDMSGDPIFLVPMDTGEAFLRNIYYSQVINKPSMAVVHPVFGATQRKRIVAILVMRIELEHALYPMIADPTGLGKSGETLIFNQQQIVLNELRWRTGAPLKLVLRSEPALLASQGRTGVMEAKDYRGTEVLSAFTWIQEMEWGLEIKQDLDEVYAPINTLLRNILIVFFISVIGACLLAVLLSRLLVHPVNEMAAVSRRVQAGELSARNVLDRRDELGSLAESFNAMADTISSQLEIGRITSGATDVMMAAASKDAFVRDVLRALVELTNSSIGVFYQRRAGTDIYEPRESVGASAGLLTPFGGKALEGEFSKVLKSGQISRIREIPPDSVFRFKTSAGDVIPREIITIPVMIEGRVEAVISLSGLNAYAEKTLQALERTWPNLNSGYAHQSARQEALVLSEELRMKNQELEVQAEELQSMTEELQHQSEELQSQNVDLEMQKLKVEEADRLKSRFLANMSHEIRTPLNSIMALSRVLQNQTEGRLTEEERSYLGIIERSGDSLLTLINDILDLSKIEAGRMSVEPVLFSIVSTVDSILESLRPIAANKNLALTREIPDDFPMVWSDEVRVHQVLQNIIGNAVKFTERGSVLVRAQHDAGNIRIHVEDTGIGIDRKDIPNVFDEFRQVDGGWSRRYEGTGLGLAIASKAAKLLGGEILVESVLGSGSVFTLTLPRRRPGELADSEKEAQAKFLPSAMVAANRKTSQPQSLRRILLIEDDAVTVCQLREALESAGYVVDVAGGGKEALEILAKSVPDGVVLDLVMPEVDGFAVLEKIRSCSRTVDLPVLILTAKDMTPEELRGLRAMNIRQLIRKGAVDLKKLQLAVESMFDTIRD